MSLLLGKADFSARCCRCHLRQPSAFRSTRPAYNNKCRQKAPRVRAAEDKQDQNGPDEQQDPQPKRTKKAGLTALNPVKLGRSSRKAINSLLAVADKAEKSRKSDSTDAGVEVNPIKLGRKSRAVLDDLWAQFATITSPTRAAPVAQQLEGSGEILSEFQTPQAASTTVLVIGATGRIGKVLVRKLLLRGYKVRALVRPRDPGDNGAVHLEDTDLHRPSSIPQAVQVVYGDLSDYRACQAAVQGVDKIIYAAKAASSADEELEIVEEAGPALVAKAFMDVQNAEAIKESLLPAVAKRSIAHFSRNPDDHRMWVVTHVGGPQNGVVMQHKPPGGSSSRLVNGQNEAVRALRERRMTMRFKGTIVSQHGYADLSYIMPEGAAQELADCDGIRLRCWGDGHVYSIILVTGTGHSYWFRFQTQLFKWMNVRMPFNFFRPSDPNDPPLKEVKDDLSSIALRFDIDGRNKPYSIRPSGQPRIPYKSGSFAIEIEYIKGAPTGEETDFILVGCAGLASRYIDVPDQEKVVQYKRQGERQLKATGLGYTVVRAGPLLEEPGGYKGLIFDQAGRITQGISCADVADVCVKALHDTAARNKTFDVSYEFTPEEGLEMYELVAHLPERSNNYLAPALANLTENT